MTRAVNAFELNDTDRSYGEDFWRQLNQDFAFEDIDNDAFDGQLRLTTAAWLAYGNRLVGLPGTATIRTTGQITGRTPGSHSSVSKADDFHPSAELAQQATTEVAIATAWQIIRVQLQRYLENPSYAPLCVQVFGNAPTANHCHLIQQLIDESRWPELIVQHHRRRLPNVMYDAPSNILSVSQKFVTQYAKTPALVARELLAGLGLFVDCHCTNVQAA